MTPVRAYLSRPDSGVTALRPDLYPADLAWLTGAADREAKRILETTEPRYQRIVIETASSDWLRSCWPVGWEREALAESLASFLTLEVE